MVKRIIILIIILSILPIIFADSINPNNLTIYGYEGEEGIREFTLTLDTNETCYWYIPSPTFGYVDIRFYPSKILGPIQTTIALWYKLKNAGNFNITAYYCNASLNLNFIVSPKPIQTVQTQTNQTQTCPRIVKVFGSPNPGKTITFDVRNEQYFRVKHSEQSISLTDEEGNTYNVECPNGFCKFQIPETVQSGKLVYEVVVPGCEPYVGEIEIKPLGQIQISAPSNIKYGITFFVYIFDPFKGPIKYANVKILKPNGEVINARTNENGIVTDESLTKTFGKELYPNMIGPWKIQVFQPGYAQATYEINVEKGACPFECCVNEELYVDKECAPGYYCLNRVCKLKELPKIDIICDPLPEIGAKSICKLYSNNTTLKITTDADFIYAGEAIKVRFVDGEATINWDRVGNYKLIVQPEGYQKAILEGEIKGMQIPLGLVAAIIFILLIVIFIFLKKKYEEKPKETRKIKVVAKGKGALEEI
ncbi:MAG: hypothetical protein ACP5G1_01625 [Nanopusillaceae archaeon]